MQYAREIVVGRDFLLFKTAVFESFRKVYFYCVSLDVDLQKLY